MAASLWNVSLCHIIAYLALSAPCQAQDKKQSFANGLISANTLYVSLETTVEKSTSLRLLRANINWQTLRLENTAEFQLEFCDLKLLRRWRLCHSHIWVTTVPVGLSTKLIRVPISEIEGFNINGNGEYFAKLRPRAIDPTFPYYMYSKTLGAIIEEYCNRHTVGISEVPEFKDHFYDFYPIAATEFNEFLLKKNKMEVWNASGARLIEKDERWDIKWSAKPTKIYDSPFCESFIVYQAVGRHYFVTKSGKIFIEPAIADKTTKLLPLLDDPDRRIEAIITDLDSTKTFIFGTDSKEKKPFVFALAPKLELSYYEPKDDGKKPRPPLEQVVAYAKYLRETNRIKDK